MNKLSPFTQWWEANIQSKMAVSDEIKTLMARAFEGGQKIRELTDEEILVLYEEYIESKNISIKNVVNFGRAVLKKASEK